MSSNDVAISVKNLSKRYEIYANPRDRLKQFVLPRLQSLVGQAPKQYFKDFWALKDVSFEVKKGETVGIIGRNGSGKSTLLQMICGTLNPTEGSIQTHGRIAALLELGSGFNPEYTGRENVYMNAAVLGLSNEEIDARFSDIVAFADIGDFIEQPVKTYSSGMMIRLAFAVAINVKPDILVIDEALSVGDIRFQSKCMRAIQEIKDKGSAILFVTHSPGQIEALCSMAVWLNDGVLKAEGLPKHLIRQYVNFMMHGIDDKNAIGDSYILNPITPENIEKPVYQWLEINAKNNVKGNLSAKITKILVRRVDAELLNIAYAKSQTISVMFTIDVHADVHIPLVAVGIFNSLNEPVVHFNTENAQKKIERLQAGSNHTFEFNFEFPALRPGEYLISIGIDDGIMGMSTALCHVYDAWIFTVTLEKGEITQAGYVQVEKNKKSIKHTIGM
ncbi:ABC transporter ATP-binding protein [Rhodoferax sp. 4810]|nr:ABC transporter ATP-binding protein [Rhodoferax jenense]